MKVTCHSELVSESKNMTNLPPHPSGFPYGRSEASPAGEQMERTGATLRQRHSASMEEIQDSPLPQGARERTSVAFTLAEVLITLGIIGVVAAMTIPNLITAHQKKVTVTKLQKAISVLNQAYRLSYDENGDITPQEAMAMGGADAYFQKYWAPYIKTAQICNWASECGYSTNTPFFGRDGINTALAVVTNDVRTTFMTAEGFVFVVFLQSGPEDARASDSRIFVDINGAKGPNMLGKDVFVLVRYIDDEKGGSIVPYGGHSKTMLTWVNSDCSSKTSTGYTCAEKIRRAGWQIEKDYPW